MEQAKLGGFVKSPLNYTGGKHKLLPKLSPLMPAGSDMVFVDLFGGGGNVVANAPDNFSMLVYNELDSNVFSLIHMMSTLSGEEIAEHVDGCIERFSLNKENKEGYLAFRAAYNESENKDVRDLFVLIAHAFSNQIRFNRKGEFNLPFGKRTFNDKMRSNLMSFTDSIQSRAFVSSNKSFDAFDFSLYPPESSFIYCDPPYLGSVATYNEHGGWTDKEEKQLLDLLDELDSRGYRWMLSNNFEYDNPLLKQWSAANDKYSVIDLEYDYKSCNYHKNAARTQAGDAGNGAVSDADDKPLTEVAIVNYQLPDAS